MNDLQELVSRLKENRDMQVETTTLGKFLGSNATKVAMTLGKDVLNRPVIISTKEDQVQILDLKTGFVIMIDKIEDLLPKLVATFSNDGSQKKTYSKPQKSSREMYDDALKSDSSQLPINRQLSELRDVIYKSGSIEQRVSLVKKTIKVLECHKAVCREHELPKVEKAQGKLTKMISYLESKKLAPGQVPSVYEIAVWDWVRC